MGMFTTAVTFPLAPVRMLTWLAEVIRDEINRELYDPASIRRQLQELPAAAAAGELTGQERQEQERELISCLVPTDANGSHESS